MTPRNWNRMRFAVLSGSFTLLVVTPLLNCYLDWNFVQGWYQSIGIGDLWVVSPLEGLESLLVTRQAYGPLLVGMLLPLLVALLLGRVFCSWICPISFLSECLDRGRALFGLKKTKDRWQLVKRILWLSLGLELLLTLVLGAPVFVFLSPPGLVGRQLMTLVFFHSLQIEALIILLILLLHLLTRRFYCRYLCPLGGLLALLGSRRRLRLVNRQEGCTACGRCDRSCPLGLTPSTGQGESAYCWNCGSCIDSCAHRQLTFRMIRKQGPGREQLGKPAG